MKWESIKDRAVAELAYSIQDGAAMLEIHRDLIACGFRVPESMRPLNHITVFDACCKEVERVVDAWDVRAAGRLREICPDAFPRSLRHGPLVAFQANNSDWVVEKKA